jgi:hypothetical protein
VSLWNARRIAAWADTPVPLGFGLVSRHIARLTRLPVAWMKEQIVFLVAL